MGDEYRFDGETVERVVESFNGDYWVITDDSGAHPFGYACLSGMRQFGEWGTLNKNIFERSNVWDVPKEAWPYTGPPQIDIKRVED
jgi:hypothetical protein